MSFFLERGRRFIAGKKDRLFTVMADTTVSKVIRLPAEKKRKLMPGVIKNLERTMKVSPALAHKMHAQLGICYQDMGDYPDAISHFDHAIALHPEPNPTGDFQSYVESYLRSLNTIKEMEPEHQKEVHEKAIDRLEELTSLLPGYEYRVRGFLGVSYLAVGKMKKALENFEKSLVSFPEPDSKDSDFPAFSQNYLNCVRLISQNAISLLNGKRRQQSVQDLVGVVNSTARVSLQARGSKEITQEHHAAFSYLQKMGATKNAVRVSLN